MAARSARVQQFVDQFWPYILEGQAATQLPPSVIIAQWGLESGYGTSRLAVEGNNLAGIRHVPRRHQQPPVDLGANGHFARFESHRDFVEDWVLILRLRAPHFGYPQLLAAAERGPQAVGLTTRLAWSEYLCRMLGQTSWDAGRYMGAAGQPEGPGGRLIHQVRTGRLWELDEVWPGSAEAPAPPQRPPAPVVPVPIVPVQPDPLNGEPGRVEPAPRPPDDDPTYRLPSLEGLRGSLVRGAVVIALVAGVVALLALVAKPAAVGIGVGVGRRVARAVEEA